jgi:SulP family sulfate permease
MLAAVLFMKRMSDLTESRMTLDASSDAGVKPPKGVVLYEINGPLFFGASQHAMSTLAALKGDTFKVLVLHLGRVPVIDATGFVALENAIASVVRRHRHVVLAGPLPKPRKIFEKADLEGKHPEVHIVGDLERALALANELTAATLPAAGASKPPPESGPARSAA